MDLGDDKPAQVRRRQRFIVPQDADIVHQQFQRARTARNQAP